ncbi:MAG: metallophosphoesterase [Planctomycetota bacterium]
MANKLILISDIHLRWDNPKGRLDDLTKTQFEKLEFVYDWAHRNNAIVCQSGDMVNKPRSWYLLPVMTKFFLRWKLKGVDTYMVRGQHDYYYYSEASGPATIIGALAEAEFITIVDGPDPIIIDLEGNRVNLYGASFGQSVPTPKKYSDRNVLLVHREISDKALFKGHKYFSHKGFLKRHKNYKVICAGDIHRKFKARMLSTSAKIERWIVNSGPMLRSTATQYNFDHKPGFYIWDPAKKKMHWKLIPCEPADDVLTRAHIKAQEEHDKAMAEFTLKLSRRNQEDDSETTYTSNFRHGLDDYMEEHKVGKEVADMIYGSLEGIDIDEL